MALEPLRVACIGMGWWSDVLADAIQRSKKLKIVACYTRSEDKRKAFASKYGCNAAPDYRAILQDRSIEAIVNTTPNDAHLETTLAASIAGKHVFLDKPIANTVSEGRAITEACRKAGVVLALGYQRRREGHFRWIRERIDAGDFGKLVNAEANISRDRLGQIDLSSWRYTAAGMPGGVMLQIGIHYADVLEYLLGPVKAVSGQFAAATKVVRVAAVDRFRVPLQLAEHAEHLFVVVVQEFDGVHAVLPMANVDGPYLSCATRGNAR